MSRGIIIAVPNAQDDAAHKKHAKTFRQDGHDRAEAAQGHGPEEHGRNVCSLSGRTGSTASTLTSCGKRQPELQLCRRFAPRVTRW